jgi:cysteine desulfurase
VCDEAIEGLDREATRLGTLRDRLWSGIQAVRGVTRLGDPDRCLPNTLSVAFEGADGETLLMALDLAGVSVSSGSACTAGSLDPSHVLLAMGLDDTTARSTVRFSIGWSTTVDDIDGAIARLPPLVDRAREMAA